MLSLLTLGKRSKSKKRRKSKNRRKQNRQRIIERLEERAMLASIPLAFDDPWYSTAADTTLVIGSADSPVLENDWDPEDNTLTASVVANPANGSLSSFASATGQFTYVPDLGFTGIDTFTYKINNGTEDSETVTASIAVGDNFGPRTNQEEQFQAQSLLTGGLSLVQPLTPGLQLVYQSDTLPTPIVALDTFLQPGSSVPDEIKAKLTFNGTAGTDYSYDTTGLTAGDTLRFALQADATSLSSGRYAYTVRLTARFGANNVTHDYTGFAAIENRGSSSHAFGRGWQLDGLDQLISGTGGVQWIRSGGDSYWFADNGSGGYLAADGDVSFSGLVKNVGGDFTLTTKEGIKANFSSAGLLTSYVDRNDNTTSYTYTSGLLTKITDPFNRDTTFTYTSGRLTSVSDFASRSATLAYDGSGRLTSVTEPDPDGAGSQTSPVTSFTYDATTHLLTKITDPLSQDTSFLYGAHDRLTKITNPGASTILLTPVQTVGMPTGSTGNSLTAANPLGDTTNERSKKSTFRTDRFGGVVEWIDPANNKTLTERDNDGLLVRLTETDPDGGGPLSSSITTYGYDDSDNLVYQENPDASSKSWTYTSTFNQVATEKNELLHTTTLSYDTDGNLTSVLTPANATTSYAYNSSGLLTSITAPDPDGAGPLSASVTSFAYDTKGRLTTLTNPDSTTLTFTYDSADNRLTEVDELTKTTTYTYDTLDRLLTVTDREAAVTTYVYDANSQLTTITDALSNDTDYTYNNRGWVTKVTLPDPDGAGALLSPETTYAYDNAGNLTELIKPEFTSTTKITYTYDNSGWLTRQTGPVSGASIDYTLDSLGRVTGFDSILTHTTSYEYNSRGWLAKKTDPAPGAALPDDFPVTEYSYDALGRTKSITDTRGYVTSYVYDVNGQIGSVTQPLIEINPAVGPQFRPTLSYQYDTAGRLTTATDPLGRETDYVYNSRNQVTSVTLPDPDGSGSQSAPVTTYAYDNAGRNTSVTDPLSRVTSYTFDDEGRVLTTTLPDPDGIGSQSAPVTTYVYNALSSVTSVTDPLSNVTTIAYDSLQRQTSVTQPDPDGAGPLSAPVTSYEYNAQALLSKVTDPISRDTTFQYDTIGRRTGVTDDSSNQTTYAFDSGNQVTSVTLPDPDGAGPLTAPVTSYNYDERNRLTKITDPNSGFTNFTYDDAGNTLSIDDSVGNTTSYAYDGLGRVTIETNELSKTRSFIYDAAGNLTRRTDRNGDAIQFVYDELNRRTEEKWLSSVTAVPSITISTVTEGGPANEVQRVGFSDMMIMDGTFTLTYSGQTTSAIAYNASAATVTAALEALSNIGVGDVAVVVTQNDWMAYEWKITFQGSLAGTNVAQTTVDSSGISAMGTPTDIEATDTAGGGGSDEIQSVTLNNASGGFFRLAFEGETTAHIADDATAATVETILEALNSVDQVTVTGSVGGPWTVNFVGTHSGTNVATMLGDATPLFNGTLDRTANYAYDAAGQLTSADDADSDYTYTYDDLGRVLTVDNQNTPNMTRVILTSAYNSNGRRTSVAADIAGTDDFLNTYSYDNLNRLTRVDQVEQTGGNSVVDKRVDFSYNAAGFFTEIERFNDVAGGSGDEIATSAYSYDSLGRLTGLSYKNGGTALFTAYSLTYDDISRVTQFVSQDGTSDFVYDVTSQLTTATHSYTTNEAYTYDANGNRTNTGYTTGSNNRLTGDGTFTYTYDDEGNRLTRTNTSTSDKTEYEWDHRNRLTKVTEKDMMGMTTQVVEYEYDIFDRRISKSIDTASPFDMADAVVERFVYDGDDVVLDFVDPDGTGASPLALQNRYLYGEAVDQILAQEDVTELTSSADRVLWPLADNQGTIRDLYKNDATLATHYKYDSFGNIISGDTSLTRYLYTAREYDSDTGLQYNRARWYDPAVGRWISEDPIGFGAGDANLARYVGNGSTNFIDPSGLQAPSFIDTYWYYLNHPSAMDTDIQIAQAAALGVASGAATAAVAVVVVPVIAASATSGLATVLAGSSPTLAASASATATATNLVNLGMITAGTIGTRNFALSTHQAYQAGNYNQVAFNVGSVLGPALAGGIYRVRLTTARTSTVARTPTARQIAAMKPCTTCGGSCFIAGTPVILNADANQLAADSVDVTLTENRQFEWILSVAFVGLALTSLKQLRRRKKKQPHEIYQEIFADEEGPQDRFGFGEEDLEEDSWLNSIQPKQGNKSMKYDDLVDLCFSSPDDDLATSEEVFSNSYDQAALDKPENNPSSTMTCCLDPPQVKPSVKRSVPVPKTKAKTKPKVELRRKLENEDSRSSSRFASWPTLWLTGCLLLASLFGYRAASSFFASPHQSSFTGSERLQTSSVSLSSSKIDQSHDSLIVTPSGHLALPIEKIQLGQRILGHNPLRQQVDSSIPDVDPETWRKISIHLVGSGGHEISVELLRSLDWLDANQLSVGGKLHMNLEELGIGGVAEILSIEPCPPLVAGNGQVVTGRIVHNSTGNLLNLHLANEAKPTGVTVTHPYWSLDRLDFVPAGDLKEGERVSTLQGETTILSITQQPVDELIYNLEIHREHVFRVGLAGALVHNMCPVPSPNPASFPSRRIPRTANGHPIPDVDTPHTQLGQAPRTGSYPVAREFDEAGNIVRDIELTTHNMPNHTNPHQHIYDPLTGARGGPLPLD